MLLEPEKATVVTTTVAYLHYFLIQNSVARNTYTPTGTLHHEDSEENIIPGGWGQDSASNTSVLSLRAVPRKSTQEVQEIRDEFASYIVIDRV